MSRTITVDVDTLNFTTTGDVRLIDLLVVATSVFEVGLASIAETSGVVIAEETWSDVSNHFTQELNTLKEQHS